MNRLMIIPAAGLGTRLDSDIPKVLYPVDGRPMLDHLISLYRNIVDVFVVVVHPSFEDRVRRHCRSLTVRMEIAIQEKPTGMLDAILSVRAVVDRSSPEEIWITWCDQVSIRPSTIRKLVRTTQEESGWSCIFPTVEKPDPYIHFVRSEDGRIVRILQRREGDEMPEYGENDMGLFCLSAAAYRDHLPEYATQSQPGKRTQERNFLPFLVWLNRSDRVVVIPGKEEIETMGINTREEVAAVETALRSRESILSVIIPAYNEERFIGSLLEKVLAVDLSDQKISKEVIVVDDCSTDGTAKIVKKFPGVQLASQIKNSGKGEAVKQGIHLCTGDYVLIQDADLEYDPEDYVPMLKAMRPNVDAVYGTRYRRFPNRGDWLNLPLSKHSNQSWPAYLGGKSLSMIAFLFTGHYLTDTVTALKLFRAEVVKFLNLKTTGFELDHEITSRLLAKGCRIEEVPIRYFPRSREEGKKIGARDWIKAVRTFHRYRNG